MNTDTHPGEAMAPHSKNDDGWRGSRWRIAAWIAAALLLLLPLIAMQFTEEVKWSAGDFVIAAVLLFGSLGAYELATRLSGNTAYRAGAGVAIVAVLLLVWMNGAVGIIGSEDNSANLLYFGVLAVGLLGSLIAYFRPRGMAYAMFATALAQAAVTAAALIGGWGAPANGPAEIIGLNGFFVVLWVASAALFREAARRASEQIEG